VDAWQSRIIRPEYAEVKASLAEVGYGSVFDMLRTYSGRGSELAPWLEGAEINRGSQPAAAVSCRARLQRESRTEIRNEMLTYRTFPADLFAGSPASLRS